MEAQHKPPSPRTTASSLGQSSVGSVFPGEICNPLATDSYFVPSTQQASSRRHSDDVVVRHAVCGDIATAAEDDRHTHTRVDRTTSDDMAIRGIRHEAGDDGLGAAGPSSRGPWVREYALMDDRGQPLLRGLDSLARTEYEILTELKAQFEKEREDREQREIAVRERLEALRAAHKA